jgi:hypothetical protein
LWWFDEEDTAFGKVREWKFGVVDVDVIREVVIGIIEFGVVGVGIKNMFQEWELEW